MKTNKSNKIKKELIEEDKKIIKEQIRAGKAMAVKYDSKEAQEIVDNKKQEGINRQKEYREIFLIRRLKEEELKEIQGQLEGEILLQWSGMKCPKNILEAQFNLNINAYKNIVSKEKYLEQALKNDGLTKDELLSVLNGKYIKNWMKK